MKTVLKGDDLSGYADAGFSSVGDVFAAPPLAAPIFAASNPPGPVHGQSMLGGTLNGTSGNDFIHVYGDGLTAPAGYNDITYGFNTVSIVYPQGGDDIIHDDGSEYGFTVNYGGNLTAKDQLFGPSYVVLDGDYSSQVVLTEANFSGMFALTLTAGHDYNLRVGNGIPGQGEFYLPVDGSTLGANDSLVFDASQEQTYGYDLRGGAGNDTLTGSQVTDLITGNGGNDHLYGGGGRDFINVGAGNAYVDGGIGDDIIGMQGNGNDTILGGYGNDAFDFDSVTLGPQDHVDGGAGTDVVEIMGDYSTRTTLSASWMTGVEKLVLDSGDFNFAVDDTFLAKKQVFTFDATDTYFTSTVIFDGSAETDGRFVFFAGPGTNIFTGGAGADVFNLFAEFFSSFDRFDGGAGKDTLIVTGHAAQNSLVFTATTIQNIDVIQIGDAADQGEDDTSYMFVLDDANVAAGHKLTLNAKYLTSLGSVYFDGSHETDGKFIMTGGAGNDTLIGGALADKISGGAGNDVITGGLGADRIDGGTGNDTFVYASAAESTSKGFDTIADFNAVTGKFDVPVQIGGVDAEVTSGELRSGHFDTDLANAVGAAQLAADHAVLFTPDSGSLKDKVFLIVDLNGVAGYQAGEDLVIELSHPANLSHLSAASFI
jgi:Ca2+-binding RTX toxin-like protein